METAKIRCRYIRYMKKWFYISLVCGISIVFFDCSSGIDSSNGTTLSDSNGVVVTRGETIPVGESLSVCVSGTGGQLDPDETVTMVCYEGDEDVDGETVDIETTFNNDNTCFTIVPTSGEFPQKKRCVLTYATTDWDLNTGCSASDDFSNPNTLDLTQASLEQGTGCWSVSFEALVPDDYSIGSLDINFLNGWGSVYKRISGNNYTVFIDTSTLSYALDAAVAPDDENATGVGFSVTESAANLLTGASTRSVSVSFEVKDDFDPGLIFQCESDIQFDPEGISTSDIDLDCGGVAIAANSGTLSNLPVIGFIKTDSAVIPYYSFDATADNPSGVTKTTFTLLGSAAVDISDFSGGADEVDIAISALPRGSITEANVVIESIAVEGDGVFVE